MNLFDRLQSERNGGLRTWPNFPFFRKARASSMEADAPIEAGEASSTARSPSPTTRIRPVLSTARLDNKTG
eukprot:scaffold1272_cov250-Pinguiococcus_pyrenoidosus.AAC.10